MDTRHGVIFDLDGVLVDSEQWWDEIRRGVVAEFGGRWTDEATTAMLGMSTPEWARYLVETLGVRGTPEQVAGTVIDRMADRYAAGPPLLPHAVQAVRDAARRVPVAIATSSPPRIIEAFLSGTGLAGTVRAAVSSEQAGAGKPDPAVYLAAAAGIDVPAGDCVAIEDSSNGLRAALNARMTVIAAPNPHFPPAPDVLARAGYRIDSLTELAPTLDRIWPA
ncbi:haloacid dehalogenase [Actinocatenispora thailandica]|uniref:Haloacid dehalogenase n=1 Tax=Actinocatenispora thailandica TaxID=227318 RepID=A0A7R7DQ68_9ACTN|nr:HAD family phosphatase [Actinocatenispora thailandica]BCJ35788.1 haloacid dehalogenase [Actinocatenispora thailandica]